MSKNKSSPIVIEVCVEGAEGARAAEQAGADRIELCSSLLEGGLTPSLGLFCHVKEVVSLPIFVMIRPRGGNFVYTDEELATMEHDIRLAAEHGAAGVVFGCLNASNNLDRGANTRLLKAAGIAATLHRAIDFTPRGVESVKIAEKLGFARVLTSGGESSAEEGTPRIARMVDAASSIVIVAGGGVNAANARAILDSTGVRELHLSASSTIREYTSKGAEDVKPALSLAPSVLPKPGERRITDPQKIEQLKAVTRSFA